MKLISASILSGAGCALLLFAAGCADTSEPVRLGVALSLQEEGIKPSRYAAELAASEINAAGGVGGRPVELVFRDDFGNSDSAVAVANALYDSDVSAVVGPAYSSMTLASAPVYNGGRRPLVQLSPSASSPLVSTAGDFTFRICPSDLAYGAALAGFAVDHGFLRAAVIYVNDAYGRGVRQTFAAEYSRLGGEIIELDPFLAASPDVGVYLLRIAREKKAQAIILAANQGEGLKVLAQIRAAKLNLPILGGDGMSGAERTNPALTEGMFVSSGYLVGDPSPLNRKFVAAYEKMFPRAGPPDQGAAASYDAVNLLAKVVKSVGSDRAAVRNALARIGTTDSAYQGVVGRVAFDSLGDVPELKVRIGLARGGILVPAQ
ncbi:MAG TPA: ABC transporter substrate-binding protein [Gemmatimonadales bacterium]|nr:ABC transporter substrate-binding protein [Gemmatimonadales bacterium]